jgi:WD40 repeat protein
VAALGDGRRALSGSYDTTLRLWDLETGRCIRTLEGHTNKVTSVAALSDNRRAVSGSNDNSLKLWDLETGRCLRTLAGHTEWVNSVAVSADGDRALSGSDDKTLRLWDLKTGRCIRTLEGHPYPVRSVAVAGDGHRALSGSEGKNLNLWELPANLGHRAPLQVTQPTGFRERVEKKSAFEDAVSRATTLLEQGSYGQCYSVIREAWRATGHAQEKRVSTIVSELHNKGRRRGITFAAMVRALEGHRDPVTSVAVSGDGRRALSGSKDTALRLWDLETGRCIRTLEGHTDWVWSVAMLGDDHRALSGGDDGNLRLWQLVRELEFD